MVERSDAPLDDGGRRRLAKIVRDCAEHHNQLIRTIEIVDPVPRLIDHHQRMNPHVTFRVPLGLLWASDERFQLGEQLIDHAELERQGEADRRSTGAQHKLFDFPPDALGREIVEADGAAQRCGISVERELEPRSKLHGPQDAKAVIYECRGVDRSQNPALKIAAAVERIEVLIGQRIPRDGIDSEVAAPRSFVNGHRRIAFDDEAFVPAPVFGLAARQTDVDYADLVDGEALADRLNRAERRQESGEIARGNAKHLHVEVFRFMTRAASKQAVTDPSSDDHRPSTTLPSGPRNVDYRGNRV
jgi:hypothetical protein